MGNNIFYSNDILKECNNCLYSKGCEYCMECINSNNLLFSKNINNYNFSIDYMNYIIDNSYYIKRKINKICKKYNYYNLDHKYINSNILFWRLYKDRNEFILSIEYKNDNNQLICKHYNHIVNIFQFLINYKEITNYLKTRKKLQIKNYPIYA